MKKEEILIIGATGNQGGAVIKHLLAKHQNIIIKALVRNPEAPNALALKKQGVILIKGAMEDSSAVQKALVGTTRLFFNTMHSTFRGEKWEDEKKRGLAVVGLLKTAKDLKQVIYSTLPAIEGYEEAYGKVAIEKEMRKLDLPLTTVLAPFYLENFINIWPPIRKYFGLLGPLQWGWLPTTKELKMPHGSVDDFGAVVAQILVLPIESYLNRKVTVVSEDLVLSEVLKKLSLGIGESIKWKPLPINVFRNLNFPKEALYSLEFYASKLSDFEKVTTSFLQTDGIGAPSLKAASQESHQLHPNILSVSDWAKANKSTLVRKSSHKSILSLLVFWAKIKSIFTKN